MNKLVVILINYNGINDTIECIKSINKSIINVDIVVVDNASIKDECDELEDTYNNVKLIKSKINLGFSGGNNLGINYALEIGYEYIMLLNNDTIIDKYMIEFLLKNANKNRITVPIMYYYDYPNEVWYSGGKINKKTGNAEHFHTNTKEKNIKCSFATGCCMLIHRNIFEKVGLLDESFFMYCEDTEFCIRLSLNNISILMIPEAKLWHKVGKSSGGENSYFSIYYITRNRLRYIKRYKNYFSKYAFLFSVISRYVRYLQFRLKKDEKAYAFIKGIEDFYNGIDGKVELKK